MVAVYIILVIVMLILTILVHELGHFLAAKAVGIKATHFSIGFGPEIVGWDRGETRYAIKWIPGGGSVRILGMNPDDEISEEDRQRSYTEAAYWKRTIVIIAGSAANIVMAFVLFYIAALGWGIPYRSESSKIGPVYKTYIVTENRKEVERKTPSSEIGLKEGDTITEVNGVRVNTWTELTDQLAPRPGQTVAITYRRGNREYTKQVKLMSVPQDGKDRGKLGIQPYIGTEEYNPLTAVWGSAKLMGLQTAAIGKGLVSLFSMSNLKMLLGMQPRTQESPQSIVGAARMSVEAAQRGLDVFLLIMAAIILFIAIFNLIPLPPFDGGHLMVIIIEKVFHRKIDMRKLAPVAWVVVILLLIVALRLMFLDIFNPISLP